MLISRAINNKVRILAAERNMNQADLHKASGVSRQLISGLWKGDTPLTTTLGRLVDLAEGLNKHSNEYRKLEWRNLLDIPTSSPARELTASELSQKQNELKLAIEDLKKERMNFRHAQRGNNEQG